MVQNIARKNATKPAAAAKTNSFKTNIIQKIAETRAEKLASKMAQKYMPAANKSPLNQTKKADSPLILLYILAILIPFVAVGIATNWDLLPVIFNILWTMLCGIPGIIHAFIVIKRTRS